MTPFGVNIYGILSHDANQTLVRLSEIRFPETPHCLSYLSSRQKWIDWWIRVIQKYVSESVVCGIEAGFAHRARLAHELFTAPHNQPKLPSQHPSIQIGLHKWGLRQEPKATVNPTTNQSPEPTGTPAPNPKIKEPKRQAGEALSEYEKARLNQIRENKAKLKELEAPNCSNTGPHSPQRPTNHGQAKHPPQQSTNNCGIHTIIRILTAHDPRLREKFSTDFIEANSTATRAWLFSRLTTPPTRQAWDQSLLSFIRAPSHGQWFKISAGKTVAEQEKCNALSTLLPDQYLSDEAIHLSLNALQYEPPIGQYVFDTLLSQIYGTDRTDRLWQALWRRSKQTGKTRLRSIILPINERNYHWYIASHPTCGADTMLHGNMHRREHQELCSRANPDGDRGQVFIKIETTRTTNKPSRQGQDQVRIPSLPKRWPYRDARTKTKAKDAQSCPPGLSGNGYPKRWTLSIPSMH